jgi:hypothetical protein
MGIRIYKLREVLQQADSQKLVLPNFQREFTYTRSQQKELLLSLFCGIPVGTILTLTAPGSSFEHRLIGRKSGIWAVQSTSDKVFLLDGQQRMSTFWNALTDVYEGLGAAEKNQLFEAVHNFLKSRWFLRLKKDSEFSDDIWGFRTLGEGEDLQLNLLPDDLNQFIVYNNSVITGPLNWLGSLQFPRVNANSTFDEISYERYLRENWLIPLHLISKPEAFNTAISRLATARFMELFTFFMSLVNDPLASYYSLTEDEKSLFGEVLGVVDEDSFKALDMPSVQAVLMDRQNSWTNRFTTFCLRVLDTDIGVIELERDAYNKGHVIFDVINRSGVKLSSFDLFCATKPDLDVRATVNRLVPNLAGMRDKNTELVSDKYTNQLLNLLRVVHGHRIDDFGSSVLKSHKIFALSSNDLRDFLEPTIEALNKAYALVHLNCGVPSIEKMPYELRILPVAFSIYLGVDGHNSSRAIYLYWLTLFGGRYRESQNIRCFGDLKAIRGLYHGIALQPEYEIGGTLWQSILDVADYNDLRSIIPDSNDYEGRTSVKDGLLQWVLSKKPLDFPPNTGQRLSSKTDKLEVHHILPLNTATTIGNSTQQIRRDSKHYLNSPLNMTYVSYESNRAIGGMDFNRYSQAFTEDLRAGHCIPDAPSAASTEAQNRVWLSERFSWIKRDIISVLNTLHGSF